MSRRFLLGRVAWRSQGLVCWYFVLVPQPFASQLEGFRAVEMMGPKYGWNPRHKRTRQRVKPCLQSSQEWHCSWTLVDLVSMRTAAAYAASRATLIASTRPRVQRFLGLDGYALELHL